MTSREIARQEGVTFSKVYGAVKELGIEKVAKPGPKGNNFDVKTTNKIINVIQGKSRSLPKKNKQPSSGDDGPKTVEGVEIV